MSTNAEAMQPIEISPQTWEKLARLGYPYGGIGICYRCGKEREYTREQMAKLLGNCPFHCGQKIDFVSKGPK